MIYAFAWDCYSYKPWLYVAKNEQEMLFKLNKEFRMNATSLSELKQQLKDDDHGQGSRGGDFDIVTPREKP